VAPECRLDTSDIVGTYSGVRPVVRTGARDPSKESREHAIWSEDGLVTVTGGKLTTFRMMARMTLKALEGRVSVGGVEKPATPPDDVLWASEWMSALDTPARQRLLGLYGSAAPMVYHAAPRECRPVPGSPVLWAELRWAARSEGVVHLDDLMLRRTRLGLLLPEGAQGLLEQVKGVVQVELGWSDAQWAAEVDRYRGIWRSSYGPPGIVGAS
jgi:glycerol-3-phosphate dehydrogenase